MKEDDDQENVVTSAGVARYPCMPSEVALQQMRNRLQLARLGKKLMKWTALASGREMRILGQELEVAYEELNATLHDAYIMLARSRYFNPNLNNIVIENVAKNAAVLVESRLKARSGVKVMQQEIKETDNDPYTYLGIEKGGEMIMEAKRQWFEIIRMLILITQLRTTFAAVEKANSAAKKKKNVFMKIIIPRTIETISYIESGLEELAREDFFRLRRFIHKKRSATPSSYQERKPMEIKERLLPKGSKRIYKVECFMCGAFLKFSLVDEREKFLERRKVDDLKHQMNEVLQIAKKLEHEGIVDINVDEFIATAEKLKEKINASPHIDQLCKTCKELLKRKHEKATEKQQQREENIKTESMALEAVLTPTNEMEKTDTAKTMMSETSIQNFNIKEIDNVNDILTLKSLDEHTSESQQSNKLKVRFTEDYEDIEEDFTHFTKTNCCGTDEISTMPYYANATIEEEKISDDQTSGEAHLKDNVEYSRIPSNSETYKGCGKRNQKPRKRVEINDVRQTNSLPTVSETDDVTPRGCISYAGITGVYIPPQNPREILLEPCLCLSSTTLLSTELDTNEH